MKSKLSKAQQARKLFYEKAFDYNIKDGRKAGLSKREMESIYKANLRTVGKHKKLKGYGSEIKVNKVTGKNEFRRTLGKIQDTKLEQLKAYNPDALDSEGNPRTLAQQAVDKAWRDRYNGRDVFAIMDELGITDYDMSEGTYVDPLTGETRSLDELVW